MGKSNFVFEVNGKPFIAIAGEVHNSSASNTTYLLKAWQKAKQLELNTVLVPVYWEMIEPAENQFELRIVEDIIMQAREHDMHLIFLWFGSWKNAQCMYAPEWVKKDLVRFPRAQVEKGKNKTRLTEFYGIEYTTLSYLGKETNKADAKAFQELMKFIKKVDETHHTVLAVQVENETGLMGSARERSDEADRLFAENVPEKLLVYLKNHTAEMESGLREKIEASADSGSWTDIFGDYAEEIFSAYYTAAYVEEVAAAGKSIYPIPMTVNCWLDKGEEPGKYPSGGPVAKVLEVWKYAAPSIDIYGPDIYVQDFCQVCDAYTKLQNPLFIPETATHAHAAPRLVYVIGHHHAAGFAPFGFEDMGEPFTSQDAFLFGVDTSDPLLQLPQSVEEYKWCAHTLKSMMELITDRYGTDDLQAVISEQNEANPQGDTMLFGEFGFQVIMDNPFVNRTDGVCMILKEETDTFYILANGCAIVPFSLDQNKENYDIICLEEGKFVKGEWKPERRLNGDEAASLCYNEYTLLKLKVFAYS